MQLIAVSYWISGARENLSTSVVFREVAHAHDEEAPISWTVDWALPDVLKINDPGGRRRDVLFQGDQLETKCQVRMRRGQLRADSLIYKFSGATFALKAKSLKATEYHLTAG